MPYVFGYASLVNSVSIEATLRRPLGPDGGPFLARLLDARRAWNICADITVRPDYVFHRADGSPWQGWIAFLGLEVAPGESTLGAFYRVTAEELDLLDHRELSYDRLDVTDRLEPLGPMPDLHDEPVEVYWPRPDVVADALRIGKDRTIMTRYLRLVDDAYRRLGPELYAEHLATMPATDGCRVEEISATPVAMDELNEAVDPKVVD